MVLAGALLCFAAPAASAVAPVAAYSFDEGTGSTLNDLVANHDGTIEGATWSGGGKYGGALDFDGTNDRVKIADAADLDLTSTFTIESWVRMDTGGTTRPVIAKTETGGGYQLVARYFGLPMGTVTNGETTKVVAGPESLPTSTWKHLVFMSDGKVMSFWIDGELIKENPAFTAKATAASLFIGNNGSAYFDGLIDEVRIYDKALTFKQLEWDRDHPLGNGLFHISGGQASGMDAGSHTFAVTGQPTNSCKTSLSNIELPGPSDTITATPAYSNCVGPSKVSFTFDTNGCEYTFHGGIGATGSMDIGGCTGAGMTYKLPFCTYTIPPQTVEDIHYGTIGSGSEREIEIHLNAVTFKTSESCFGEGAKNVNLTYLGKWYVAALNEGGAWFE